MEKAISAIPEGLKCGTRSTFVYCKLWDYTKYVSVCEFLSTKGWMKMNAVTMWVKWGWRLWTTIALPSDPLFHHPQSRFNFNSMKDSHLLSIMLWQFEQNQSSPDMTMAIRTEKASWFQKFFLSILYLLCMEWRYNLEHLIYWISLNIK
jgi:hypothetical protein